MALGKYVQQMPLYLSVGTAFTETITPSSTPYPSGMTAWIVLLDSSGNTLDTWNATVTAGSVVWWVANSSTDAIPLNASYRMYAQMPTSPATTELWYYGPVVRLQ